MKTSDIIREENVKSIRPGFGLHPKYYAQLLSKTVQTDIEEGTKFSLTHLSSHE